MDSNDTASKDEGQKIEVKTEAIQDMTVDDKGAMENAPAADSSNEVTAPEPMMDVTPPPQDEVVAVPTEPTPEQAAPTSDNAATTEAPAEQVFNPAGAEAVVSASAAMPKKSGKGLVVAIAVVLALVLAAIAVLVYMKANTSTKNTSKSSTSNSSNTQQAAKATATDVDTTAKAVDDTLSTLNDTQDFASDVISDKALGLQ